jgi:thioredoxin 1
MGVIMSKPIPIHEDAFENVVIRSSLPVLVHFWAPWCPPCREISPSMEAIAREYDGRLIVAEVNTDLDPDLASRYGAGRIPNILLISGGQVIQQEVGVVAYPALCQMVDRVLAPSEAISSVRQV